MFKLNLKDKQCKQLNEKDIRRLNYLIVINLQLKTM